MRRRRAESGTHHIGYQHEHNKLQCGMCMLNSYQQFEFFTIRLGCLTMTHGSRVRRRSALQVIMTTLTSPQASTHWTLATTHIRIGGIRFKRWFLGFRYICEKIQRTAESYRDTRRVSHKAFIVWFSLLVSTGRLSNRTRQKVSIANSSKRQTTSSDKRGVNSSEVRILVHD